MASVLEELARRAAKSPTGERAVWFLSLRQYLQNTDVNTLVRDIEQFQDADLLSYILGAGAPKPVQDALLKRYRELRGG
jgi:hypothetical protein